MYAIIAIPKITAPMITIAPIPTIFTGLRARKPIDLNFSNLSRLVTSKLAERR
jgi:hypothetical protein